MAKLTIREETPIPPPKVYVLELSEEEEAWALRRTLGASGFNGPAGLSTIYAALADQLHYSDPRNDGVRYTVQPRPM